MSTSSEDVLASFSHVKYKKSDGILYVMAERIAWIMNGRDTFTVSHKYSDIKMQKISPDGKSKIQLQVVIHDGGASTFHFTNPEGSERQIAERDQVKEFLQQLLPKFKRKVNRELEEKNNLLANDPELFQLYRDLVTSQVITAEEFWASHIPKKDQATQLSPSQITGVSGAFLADIKPQTDGCNGLKYNLTADVIESIFKTYPAVKRKHIEYVPDKLTESEFWTRFFQSHYFHRDRMNSGTKDLFAECMKNDELDIKKELLFVAKEPLLNIPEFKDINTVDDSDETLPQPQLQNNAINQNMIRRFNHHSMMVLKSCQTNNESTLLASVETPNCQNNNQKIASKEQKQVNGLTNNHADSISEVDSEVAPVQKKAKIQSKITYDDLEEKNEANVSNLNLTRADRYFHGPTPVTSVDYTTREELLETVHSIHQEIQSWNPCLPLALPSHNALTVLGALSPGGAHMTGVHSQNLQQTVPQHIQTEMKNLYSALCELLRHFWSCFPVNSEQLEEKVMRMRANIERFQYAKLKPFQDLLLRDHYNTNLADHLSELIEAALMKFNTWQMRRHSRKILQ